MTSLTPQIGDEPLHTPFDISLTPVNLGTFDAPGQEFALAGALRGSESVLDNSEGFSDERPKDLPLRWLQTWSERSQAASAISALVGRKNINYTRGGYTVKANDGNIFWTAEKTYLDLLICVGRGLGLGPLLPNSHVLHTYEFKIDFKQPKRHFTAKYAKIGFNPTEAMLWIGRSSASEDVWLAFAPRVFAEGGIYNDEVGVHWRGPRVTALSQNHFRCVVMFLARMLCNIGFLDITLDEDYPDVTCDSDFKYATNLQ